MPPKDVKSAKKLYAKMKKAQKNAASKESTPADDSAPDTRSTDEADAADAGDSAVEHTASVAGAEKETEAGRSEEASGSEHQETQESKRSDVSGEAAEDEKSPEDTNNSKDAAKDLSNASGDKEEQQKPSDDIIADTKPEAVPSATSRSKTSEPDGAVEETNATEATEPDVITKDAPKEDSAEEEATKEEAVKEAATTDRAAKEEKAGNDTAATEPNMDNSEKTKNTPPGRDVSAATAEAVKDSGSPITGKELIADLRQENHDLKAHVAQLETRIKSLEYELSSLRRHEPELSLSPILDMSQPERSERNRSSSFVEADLYSEAEKISKRTEQMNQWKGYQLDLRNWQRLGGIGPVISF